jgi:hypothetical protein
MILEFWYEPLQLIIRKMNDAESDTYRYSWIIIVLLKKFEYMDWIVAAKLRNIVMLIELCR